MRPNHRAALDPPGTPQARSPRRRALAGAAACAAVLTAVAGLGHPPFAHAANASDVTLSGSKPTHAGAQCDTDSASALVGGRCRWAALMQYAVRPDATAAVLTVKSDRPLKGRIVVRSVRDSGKLGKTIASAKAAKAAKGSKTVSFDVRKALPRAGGDVRLAVTGGSKKKTVRLRSMTLTITAQGEKTVLDPRAPGTGTKAPAGSPGAKPSAPAAPAPAEAPKPAPSASSPAGGQARPPVDGASVWVSRAELAARPMSGPAWNALKATADGSLGAANIADQDSSHDVDTLAAALAYARTGDNGYRAKAAAAVASAIGTEQGGRTLALARNLNSYVIAADLIDLKSYDSGIDGRFRSWLSSVRSEDLQGLTLISTHEKRPNNWGTMAGASRIAADVYLGDTADLHRAATVFKGFTGDRGAYSGFDFGDTSYQADPGAPVGINPTGASKNGVDVDGALPDDMRRGCSFAATPCHTGYPWEAMQGVVTQAELLSRHGFAAWSWSDNAVLRAASYLQRLDAKFGGWWASGDDAWQPVLINHAYGTSFPASGTGAGKVFGWTDWVYGG